MHVHCLMLLIGLAGAGHDQLIDDFQYADAQAARQAWTASSRTPTVDVTKDGDRTVVEFKTPFQADPKLERTILDRNVKLDLAVPGQFTLELKAEDPEAVGSVSVYFRSGKGWYSGGQGLAKKGWQRLVFSKAAFHVEGEPAGWHKVDGVRISVWRGQSKDSSVRLGQLAATWNDVALVIPAAHAYKDYPERDAAMDSAERVAGMLDDLGLGSDAIEDAALSQGAAGRPQRGDPRLQSAGQRRGDRRVGKVHRFGREGVGLLLDPAATGQGDRHGEIQVRRAETARVLRGDAF